jgi:pimeloyl-ACP methyl ester carboxylesterase
LTKIHNLDGLSTNLGRRVIKKVPFQAIKQGKIHYQVYGKGPEILFAFHGFGQTQQLFEPLSHHFHSLTIFAFDLFFHGESQWEGENLHWEPAELAELLVQMAQKNGAERFGLMGFSLGSKIALNLAGLLPNRLTRLFLLAPDGLVENPWYNFSTRTKFGQSLLHWYLEKGEAIVAIGTLGNRMGLLPKTLLRMVQANAGSAKERRRLHHTWLLYRHFRMPGHLHEKISGYHIPVIFVLGKTDEVIRKKSIIAKINQFTTGNVIELPAGHFNLMKAYLKYLEKK